MFGLNTKEIDDNFDELERKIAISKRKQELLRDISFYKGIHNSQNSERRDKLTSQDFLVIMNLFEELLTLEDDL